MQNKKKYFNSYFNMHVSHISIGGGITGLETIISTFYNIQKKLKSSKKKCLKLKNKKFIFAIVDKKPENIPGGVAYGFENSKYGYFNNPVRLSPKRFVDWLLKKENKRKLIKYLNLHGGLTGKDWLKKNKRILFSSHKKSISELYIPRALLNFWMEEKLFKLIKEMKNVSKKLSIHFEICFIKGEVIRIEKDLKKYNKIIFKNNCFEELKYSIEPLFLKKLSLKKSRKRNDNIYAITQNVGVGLPPPRQLATNEAQKDNFYIWDFYSEGSTNKLIEKILYLNLKKKKIKLYFIGYKAGLLEALPELKNNILKNKIKIEILCSSSDLTGIQKAERSKYKKFFFTFLREKYLHKITSAKHLYNSILKEFNQAEIIGYKKYDVWTNILARNILNKCIKKFSTLEKKKYNDIYHNKIRNITRFTYPETINARERLSKLNILKTEKETVLKVMKLKNKLLVIAQNSKKIKKYLCDIVINVSGPLNPKKITNELQIVKSLKKNGAKVAVGGGFLVNKYFKIDGLKNIYAPGILSNGFNPERKTIIKAILENSNKTGIGIAKTLIGG